MGGVSGNAGLFSNAPDLMKFMLMMLDQSPVKLVSAETLHYWTSLVSLIKIFSGFIRIKPLNTEILGP